MEKKEDYIIVSCPKCNDFIQIFIKDLNCKIFRHAVKKNNFELVNPHCSKDILDKMLEDNIIYGCATPFNIILKEGKYVAKICDYI